MLKLMLIERRGVVTHRVMSKDTTFHDFIEAVTFENFHHTNGMKWDETHKTVQVPYSGTTYTMLEVADAVATKDLTQAA